MTPDPDRPAPRRRRRWPLVAAAVAAVAMGLLVVLVGFGGGGSPSLHADAVEPPRDAPATAGRDQDGRPVSIPTPGRPALVTFLFANCPDVCPLAAQEISQALDRAGVGPEQIDVVAVSVDPRGDTRAAVREFLERHRLTGRMRYIVGSRAQREPLWRAWMIAAQTGDARDSVHSARIVLVDGTGRQVGSYAAGLPINVQDLADDLRSLTR